MRVDKSQAHALVWPETLMRSQRLSCALIEFEPAQFFIESRREFSLVWSELMTAKENPFATHILQHSAVLVLVWPVGF